MLNRITSGKLLNLILLGVFMFVFGSVLNAVNLQATANECGTINIPKGHYMVGNQTYKGFWPFAVSIYETQDYRLFCGGTLISRKHVLTAAHCVRDKSIGLEYIPTEIAVLLGSFVSLAESKGMKDFNISEIIVHPDWDMFSKTGLDADVAILVIDNSITLTNDIRIVCLPSDDDVIDNSEGYIVEWNLMLETPKHLIVNTSSDCYTKNLFHSSLLSPRTFCSRANNVSLTKRISGGGFFIGSGSAWVQHGIAVSVTEATNNNSSDEVIVFLMNVASFKNWIADTVRQSGEVIGEAIKGRIHLECNFGRLYYAYACVAHSLNVLSKNFGVDKLIGVHESKENNNKVELLQFHNGTMFYLVDGIGKLFPNLKSVFVGYSDTLTLNTKLIRRSNFQNMKNVFEIAIHKSDIETIPEDLLWDLPNLERFQLDGKLVDLPERTFENNRKLKEVYLASNALVFLHRNLFKNNLDLIWVNFADNSLKFIETDFMRLPNIRYIFLAGNVCIDKNLNRTTEQIETLYQNTDSYEVRKVIDLQRLIYSNCAFFT